MMEPHIAMEPNDTHCGLSDDELNAWLDGRLTDEQRRIFELRLAGDSSARATVAAYQRQHDALRDLHRSLLDEPVPPPLESAARQLTESRQRQDLWWRWGGLAASLALTFATGWFSHGQWTAARSDRTLASRPADPARTFVQQAAVAHAVFAPETRHPVEVSAAQQEHLVQWLSRRLGHPLKVPDLSGQGYELVGGRLLPGDDGARAQFMFQSASGERVTLYVGAMENAAGTAAGPETGFRFTGAGPVPGFYWIDQGFGYAIAGHLSRDQLFQVAQAVHGQL